MQELRTRVEAALKEITKGQPQRSTITSLLTDVLEHLDAQDPVTLALKSMSFSELKATVAMAGAFPTEDGGLFIASILADKVGITRSVIVNAIRKLESAGAVQARSLGMKGTNIKSMVPGLRTKLLKAG